MPTLLFVHHTVSPPLQELFEESLAAVSTAATELGIDCQVRHVAALTAAPLQVLEADAVLLGSPVNLGYLSGALKHFFDQIYYPCLNETVGLPFGAYLHGNNDITGAERALTSITTGLRWKPVRPPVAVISGADLDHRDELLDLCGLLVAAASERSG